MYHNITCKIKPVKFQDRNWFFFSSKHGGLNCNFNVFAGQALHTYCNSVVPDDVIALVWCKTQLYIQLVYRPHFGTWILLFGPFGLWKKSGFEFFCTTFEGGFFNFLWAKKNWIFYWNLNFECNIESLSIELGWKIKSAQMGRTSSIIFQKRLPFFSSKTNRLFQSNFLFVKKIDWYHRTDQILILIYSVFRQ